MPMSDEELDRHADHAEGVWLRRGAGPMTQEQRELARRLAEAEWREWRGGMAMLVPIGPALAKARLDTDAPRGDKSDGAIPDLSDPATVGVLIGMLWELPFPIQPSIRRDHSSGHTQVIISATGVLDIYGN